MAANDNLPAASFDAIEFPVLRRHAKLVNRFHVHEFWKMPGGAPEKGGRKVWEFSFEIPFHDTSERFPDLYPGSLRAMQQRAEEMTTAPLRIPEIGTIRAFITEFDREREGKIRSGEAVSIRFVEDDLEPFQRISAPTTKTTFDSAAAVITKSVYFDPTAPLVNVRDDKERQNTKNLWDSLNDAINAVSAIKDQAQLYGNLFASKLERVASLCKAIHNTIHFLAKPEFHQVSRALRNLWDASNQLQRDLHKQGRTLVPYRVPSTMAVGQIAKALYGDASRGGEILSLNAIKDPFAVKAGTELQVYPKAA